MGSAATEICRAVSQREVLTISGWWFCITPVRGSVDMLVSEIVDEAVCKRHPKPKPLPIPEPTKAKPRSKPKKRSKPKPFNEPKPDDLS
jgi:outer membrane biosynthesis protein TonB